MLDDKTTDNTDIIATLLGSDLAAELIIHTADLSSPSKPWEIALKWSQRVNEEFKVQNTIEEQYSEIPITPFFRNLNNKSVLAK